VRACVAALVAANGNSQRSTGASDDDDDDEEAGPRRDAVRVPVARPRRGSYAISSRTRVLLAKRIVIPRVIVRYGRVSPGRPVARLPALVALVNRAMKRAEGADADRGREEAGGPLTAVKGRNDAVFGRISSWPSFGESCRSAGLFDVYDDARGTEMQTIGSIEFREPNATLVIP